MRIFSNRPGLFFGNSLLFLFVVAALLAKTDLAFEFGALNSFKYLFFALLAGYCALARTDGLFARSVIILMLALPYSYSFLTGYQDHYIFLSIICVLVLGSVNLSAMPGLRAGLIVGLAISLAISLKTGDYFNVYLPDRARLTLGFANPNYLGQYAAIAILLSRRQGKKIRLQNILLLTLVILSGARSTILALAIAFAFLMPPFWKNGAISKSGKLAFNIYSIAYMTVTVAVLSIGFFVSAQAVHDSRVNAFASNRLEIWQRALSGSSPYGGADPEKNYLSLNQQIEKRGGTRVSADSNVVSTYLELGVLALPVLVTLWILLVRCGTRTTPWELSLLVFLATLALVETVGVGAGTLSGVMYTSLLVHFGGVLKVTRKPAGTRYFGTGGVRGDGLNRGCTQVS